MEQLNNTQLIHAALVEDKVVNAKVVKSTKNNIETIEQMLSNLIAHANNTMDDNNTTIDALLAKCRGAFKLIHAIVLIAQEDLRKPKWYEFRKRSNKIPSSVWNTCNDFIVLNIEGITRTLDLILKKLNLNNQTTYTVLLLNKLFTSFNTFKIYKQSFTNRRFFMVEILIQLTDEQIKLEIDNTLEELNTFISLFDNVCNWLEF